MVAFFRNVPSMVPIIAMLSLLLFQYLFQFLGLYVSNLSKFYCWCKIKSKKTNFELFSIYSLEIKIVRIYRSTRLQLHIALVRNYLLNIVMIASMVWYWLSHTEEKVKKNLSQKQQKGRRKYFEF